MATRVKQDKEKEKVGLAQDGVSPKDVTLANQRYHDQIVGKYESITHAGCSHYDLRVARRLAEIVKRLGATTDRCALDIGAGTGFFTKHLLRAGFSVDAVEVSGGMADELEKRYGGDGRLRVIREDAVNYLSSCDKRYDLVSFVSVLHHLFDYCEVLKHAAEHVAEGGFLYTTCDPVAPDNAGAHRLLRAMDKAAYVLARPSIIARRLTRASHSPAEDGAEMDLAEFHARSGVDLHRIREALSCEGLTPVALVKNSGCRTSAFRFLEERTGAGSDLETLWQRPARE
jgi:SAM-dependent methyltransferase